VRIEPRVLRCLSHATVRYPARLRERVLAAASATAPEISALNADLGRFFARVAVRALAGRTADVIGSHGQTVWHAPGRHTLQLGEAAFIAEATGVTTVCDFRPRDIAAGGQGAPLVPYFDAVLFAGKPVALLNLGGIANVTFPGRRIEDTVGFDTGPGNCLIDDAMRIAYRKPFDAGGRVAEGGEIDLRLAKALEHPWLRRPPPKSTGRELWSRAFLLERAGRELRRRPRDVVATLAYFTARTIADAVKRWAPRPVQEVLVSGGGVKNRAILRHLEWLLWPSLPRPLDVYGIPAEAKEAAAFALLAAQAVRGRPTNVPSATGARRAVVLGKILPGRSP